MALPQEAQALVSAAKSCSRLSLAAHLLSHQQEWDGRGVFLEFPLHPRSNCHGVATPILDAVLSALTTSCMWPSETPALGCHSRLQSAALKGIFHPTLSELGCNGSDPR